MSINESMLHFQEANAIKEVGVILQCMLGDRNGVAWRYSDFVEFVLLYYQSKFRLKMTIAYPITQQWTKTAIIALPMTSLNRVTNYPLHVILSFSPCSFLLRNFRNQSQQSTPTIVESLTVNGGTTLTWQVARVLIQSKANDRNVNVTKGSSWTQTNG